MPFESYEHSQSGQQGCQDDMLIFSLYDGH